MESKEIKEKAKKILNDYNIEEMSGENEIVEILYDLVNGSTSFINDEKMLNNIEQYLVIKSKLDKVIRTKKDYESLKELSKKLKQQEVRRTDPIFDNENVFMIHSKDGKQYLFITKEGAKQYATEHIENFTYPLIIDILPQKDTDLNKLLEIIKRNF